jgi:hypothetical protein
LGYDWHGLISSDGLLWCTPRANSGMLAGKIFDDEAFCALAEKVN